MSKVSVIIPNYNHAPFLAQRIDSVLNQTYTDFELIILDDASKDDSAEIISRYENDDRISHIVYSNENSGSPFVQWKKGIDLSAGEFIWIAESDDWAEPFFLEKMLSIIEQDEHIGLVYSDSNVYKENNDITKFSILNNKFDCSSKWSSSYVVTGELEMNKMAFFCTINNVSAVVFRKESLMNIDIPLNFRFMGDWFVYVQILTNGWHLAYSNESLNNYRYHDNNLTKKSAIGTQYVYERFCLVDYIIKKSDYINLDLLQRELYNYTCNRILSFSEIILFLKKCYSINCLLAFKLSTKYLLHLVKTKVKKMLFK